MKTRDKKLKIIAIASGKGGVGKSTIAANIASLLASKSKKVIILDASIGLANLDIIFNVNAKKNLLNFLEDECTLDEITIKLNDNLYLIPAESGSDILSFDSKSLYDILKNNLQSLDSFDYLIMDIGSGINSYVQTFLKNADECVLVTTPNPTAITDVYTMIKILSSTHGNINLIVNKTNSEDEGIFIYKNIQKVVYNNIAKDILINYLGSLNYSKNILKHSKLRKLFSSNSFSTYQLENIIENLCRDYKSSKSKSKLKLFTIKILENF